MCSALVTACAVLLVLLGAAAGHAEKRVALVIGNSDYQHADKLANPLTDARRMRDKLDGLGFTVVFGENVGKQALERAIGEFAVAARDADVALVYYAGHGATFGDVPYVVPVDARFESLEGMPYELVPVETLIGELRRAKGVRIAILDACRDNAAERELKRVAVRGGEVTRGLARVRNPEGLILAYATQYMATAADGPANGDSPFTAALLDTIATPGLDLKDVFFRAAREVVARTNGTQRPEISMSFYDDYKLVPAALSAPAAGATQSPSANVSGAFCPDRDTARNGFALVDEPGKKRIEVRWLPDNMMQWRSFNNGQTVSGVSFVGRYLVSTEGPSGTTKYIYDFDYTKAPPLEVGYRKTYHVTYAMPNGDSRTTETALSVEGRERVTIGSCGYDTFVIQLNSTDVDAKTKQTSKRSTRYNYSPELQANLGLRMTIESESRPTQTIDTAFTRIEPLDR